MIALSFAIVGASWWFSLIRPIGLFQALTAIFISAVFVVLAYAVKPLLEGVKGVEYKDMLKGGVVIVALSAAVVAASWLLKLMPDIEIGTIIKFGIMAVALAITTVVMAGAVRVVKSLGSDKDYIEGGISVLIIATTIAASSLILSLGDYSTYPSLGWALGVGLSLAAFGLGAVLLGTQAFNPEFYLGLGVILVVAASIVATDIILGFGKYDKYPSMSWVIPTMFIIGTFAFIAAGLAIISPLIVVGSIAALLVVGTIYLIDKVFSGGKFQKYPDDKWMKGVSHVIDRLAHIISDIRKKISFGDLVIGSIKLMSVVFTVYLIDKLFSSGKFQKYPDDKWMSGVTRVIDKMAKIIVNIRKNVGFGDLIIGSLKLLGLVGTIRLMDDILNGGLFKNYPSKDWVDGVSYSIVKFTDLMGDTSFLSVIGGRIKSFLGGGIDDVARKIVSISNIFSKSNFNQYPTKSWLDGVKYSISQFGTITASMPKIDYSPIMVWMANRIAGVSHALSAGDYTKYPSKSFMDGTIYALQKFQDIQSLVNFDTNGIKGMNGVDKIVSNITLLAEAFDKLSTSMSGFSNSIQSLDAEKLQMIKGLTSNVILLSLMDPEMFDQMMDKLEKRGGVFNDLIKDFEEKKEGSKSSGTVKAAVSATSQGKSDAQILGEKVDRMTALLADISSVVGSQGALKTYLNSIKDKQLHGSSNAPSTQRSDKRLKNIIKKIGESSLGLNIYLFTYTFNPKVIYQGVMAQELLNTPYESALITDKNGFYQVDYSKIDVEFKKITTTKEL